MGKRRKLVAIATAVSTGVIVALVAVAIASRQGGPQVTPLTGFSAPFVFGRFNIPDENPLTNEAFELGRRLFYDARLSGNNQVSCATCHIQRLRDLRQSAWL
jgi:cytochrome c peroxidase